MRELWWRACGAWDRTVSLKVMVFAALGGQVTPTTGQEMHPLRAREIPPPTPEEVAAANALAFDLLGRSLKSHWEQNHNGG